MAFEFARQMEREAEELAQGFEATIDGVKPWYSYARLFDGPATRVFVGINPGGTGKSEELDEEYREWAYEKPGYCAWLDERWERRRGGLYAIGASPLQTRARQVFQEMYGENWEDMLRDTPCFNVVPFRTRRGTQLSRSAKDVARPWFQKAIEHLKPNLIIGIGNGPNPSPWFALNKLYLIKWNPSDDIRTRPDAGGYIKLGTITSAPLFQTKVVALPHLSQFGGDDLLRGLRQLRVKRPSLFV